MIDIVVPTIGRAALFDLFASLASAGGPRPARIIVVDDRRRRDIPLFATGLPPALRPITAVVAGKAAGPAAARNTGWRLSTAEWIAFLDDDVVVGANWLQELSDDLQRCGDDVAGSQGRIAVPLPAGRRPTDWERNVAGLEGARWITADCAYRRRDLLAAGGFDERFPRAFREDVDLALRIIGRGRRIVTGSRSSRHPAGVARRYVSIAAQAGNADDVLMQALHGPDWYERAGAPRGAFRSHALAVTLCALAVTAAAGWLAVTLDFARRRIAPGPRTRTEIGEMLVTSFAIPFAATYHRLRGIAQLRKLLADRVRAPQPPVRAVLFDRDGTLVVDVPYNADPSAVEPMPQAREAVARLRAAGIAVGIVSNQSGVAQGKLTLADVAAVNARVQEVLGPFDSIEICPHGVADRCACRKPAPGMIVASAARLGVAARECALIGDIGSDIDAARAAGVRAILVPTAVTRPAEIAAAPEVARSLNDAVDRLIGAGA